MKKLAMILAGAVAVLGFTGCEDDKEPRVDVNPESLNFKINPPVMANQYITLSNDLKTEECIGLTCSQPDYGFAVLTTYQVQVSLSPDFKHNAALNHDGEDSYIPRKGDFVELKGASTQAEIQIRQLYLTRAICKLLYYVPTETLTVGDEQFEAGKPVYMEDVEDAYLLPVLLEKNYGTSDAFIPVYFRVRAYISQAEEASSVVSKNVVVYNHIHPTFALAMQNYIYMTGQFNGWNAPQAKNCGGFDQPSNKLWPLVELKSEIDSDIYRASWNLKPSGSNEFRFYQIPPADGWGTTGSWGAKEEDFSFVEMKLEDGLASLPAIEGGLGNFKLLSADGDTFIDEGWYDVVVNLKNKEVTIEKVEEPTWPDLPDM